MNFIGPNLQANFNDKDGGVLYGRWDNDYPKDTTAPTAWSGSVAILEKFWQKKNVVKFAQCWVFSGLVTTCMCSSQCNKQSSRRIALRTV